LPAAFCFFGFATNDLLSPEKQRRRVDSQSVGAVPLGVPLTVGPAVLTTIILLANQHGRLPTVLAIIANVLIAGGVFWFSRIVDRLLGRTGIRTISKIASLILAAIAVMMVRLGVSEILADVTLSPKAP
jgi:multiple antibiotic resistance protein